VSNFRSIASALLNPGSTILLYSLLRKRYFPRRKRRCKKNSIAWNRKQKSVSAIPRSMITYSGNHVFESIVASVMLEYVFRDFGIVLFLSKISYPVSQSSSTHISSDLIYRRNFIAEFFADYVN